MRFAAACAASAASDTAVVAVAAADCQPLLHTVLRRIDLVVELRTGCSAAAALRIGSEAAVHCIGSAAAHRIDCSEAAGLRRTGLEAELHSEEHILAVSEVDILGSAEVGTLVAVQAAAGRSSADRIRTAVVAAAGIAAAAVAARRSSEEPIHTAADSAAALHTAHRPPVAEEPRTLAEAAPRLGIHLAAEEHHTPRRHNGACFPSRRSVSADLPSRFFLLFLEPLYRFGTNARR